jgi:outer membrane protein assembly factor BamB
MRARHLALVALLAAGCGEPTFSVHRGDNSLQDLNQAMQKGAKPAQGPTNATGHAMAFLVTPPPTRLVAYDMVDAKALWTVETDITSRVSVGREQVYHRVGDDRIVGRDVRTGAQVWTWTVPPGSHLLGLAGDERQAYVITYRDEGSRRHSTIRAVRNGSVAWTQEAVGRIASPAAAGGLVYVPFLSQYLAVLDANSGAELARLRPGREMVTFARTLPEGVFYGDQGVYLLNGRSVKGKRSESAFRTAKLPEDIVRTFYYWDGYNPAQLRYSAFDRNRLLWRCDVAGEGFDFRGALVIASFRFLFAFDPALGQLRWAHAHRGGDVAASEHLGKTVAFAASNGELVALDVTSGTKIWSGKAGVPVIGATFDADGFQPAGASPQPAESLAVVLRRIVWDPDRRFVAVKVFAIDALSRMPGTEVSRELLKVVTKEGIPRELYNRAGDALVARKDPGVLADLINALKVRYDYADASKPRGLEILARALAALETNQGLDLLIDHLMDPETSLVAVREIAVAATRAKARVAIPPMRDYLTTYRADPAFSADPGPIIAVVEGLLQIGGSKERQLLKFVADDPRTVEKLRAYITNALEQTRPGKGAAAPGAKGAAL